MFKDIIREWLVDKKVVQTYNGAHEWSKSGMSEFKKPCEARTTGQLNLVGAQWVLKTLLRNSDTKSLKMLCVIFIKSSKAQLWVPESQIWITELIWISDMNLLSLN